MELIIQPNKERFQMAGGFGASWHTITLPNSEIDNSTSYKEARHYLNSRGSAWGGNPPLSNPLAWEQLFDHANKLGFSFMRIELSLRMFRPEKDLYDWENEEMQQLYRILDWAEANDVDIFLQNMWSNVKWNAFDDVQPLISAPKSYSDFAESMAVLLNYLTKTRGYSCIKWFCLSNEPTGGSWYDWWCDKESGKEKKFTDIYPVVYEMFKKHHVTVPLSGPDWTDLPSFDSEKIDFDNYISAYDIHSYQGITEEGKKELEKWVIWANQHNKPLFLTEIGNQPLVKNLRDPENAKTGNVNSLEESLCNATDILKGLEVGVGAFNRWSFTNRGDLDGQWQLVRTWDLENKVYYKEITPEPVSYYGYAIISSFCPKQSFIVDSQLVCKSENVFSQTIKTKKGDISTFLINRSEESKEISITYEDLKQSILYLYAIEDAETFDTSYRLHIKSELLMEAHKPLVLNLPPKSITTISSIYLASF